MPIDRRKNYGILLDTETTNSIEDNFFYDIGWLVIDTKGNVYEQRSFVNKDIFLHERALMETAYYKDKLPNYWKDIWKRERQVADTYTIRQQMIADCEKYHCSFITAHNSAFDLRSLNKTQRWVSKSKYRYFLPKSLNLEWWDTLIMARQVIATKPTYQKWCAENNYLTAQGKPKLTAEIIYRYIAQDHAFDEAHTALADCLIEKDILTYCLRQHKKMRKKLFKTP